MKSKFATQEEIEVRSMRAACDILGHAKFRVGRAGNGVEGSGGCDLPLGWKFGRAYREILVHFKGCHKVGLPGMGCIKFNVGRKWILTVS